jgi:aminopeptidase
MAGPDPRAFAALLCGYCLDVDEGEQVLVRSTTLAAPLLLELQGEILRRGAWPLLRIEVPGEASSFYANARDEQLDDFAPLALTEAKKANKVLSIQATADARELAGIDPARMARVARARKPIREATLKRQWCTTLWPTAALAAEAGMSEDDYRAFVQRALFLDQPDATRSWGELHAFQDHLIGRLAKASELHLEADGTDLVLNVKGRTWVNSDGRRNMPSGEVFTGPLEASANGTVRFTVRSSPAGVDVDGVELTFRDGEVVGAQADSGDDYLQAALATDEGARRLGEIGIGTNFGIDRPTGAPQFRRRSGRMRAPTWGGCSVTRATGRSLCGA